MEQMEGDVSDPFKVAEGQNSIENIIAREMINENKTTDPRLMKADEVYRLAMSLGI